MKSMSKKLVSSLSLKIEYECKRCKIKVGSNPSPKLLKYCQCEVKVK